LYDDSAGFGGDNTYGWGSAENQAADFVVRLGPQLAATNHAL